MININQNAQRKDEMGIYTAALLAISRQSVERGSNAIAIPTKEMIGKTSTIPIKSKILAFFG